MAMAEGDLQSKDEAMKLRVSVQCAKAAVLLSSLNSQNRLRQITKNDDVEEREMMKREIGDLKIELVRERMKNKRIKQCGLMEMIMQLIFVLFISSFIRIFVNKS